MSRKSKSSGGVMKQVMSPFQQLINVLKKVVRNDLARWGLRLLVIVYVVMAIPQMNEDNLEVFDNVVFRLFMVFLVVLLCQVDQALALLVAVSYVVSLQKLNQLRLSNSQTLPQQNKVRPSVKPQLRAQDLAQQVQLPQVEGFQNQVSNSKFTSNNQLYDCQNNFIGGEDNQTNQVQSWRNEMGPQGLSLPVGGANANSLPAPF